MHPYTQTTIVTIVTLSLTACATTPVNRQTRDTRSQIQNTIDFEYPAGRNDDAIALLLRVNSVIHTARVVLDEEMYAAHAALDEAMRIVWAALDELEADVLGGRAGFSGMMSPLEVNSMMRAARAEVDEERRAARIALDGEMHAAQAVLDKFEADLLEIRPELIRSFSMLDRLIQMAEAGEISADDATLLEANSKMHAIWAALDELEAVVLRSSAATSDHYRAIIDSLRNKLKLIPAPDEI